MSCIALINVYGYELDDLFEIKPDKFVPSEQCSVKKIEK